MSTGRINNNPYLQQILAQNLSSSKIQPNQLKDSAKLLTSAVQSKATTAAISSNGNKINKISQTIRESSDMQAFGGFQNAVTRLGSGSDQLKTIRFINSASVLAEQDSAALNQTFSNLDNVTNNYDQGMADTFTNVFTSTMEKAGTQGIRSFNQAFAAVESADYSGSSVSRQENVGRLLQSVAEVNLSGEDSTAINGDLQRLARGVELAESPGKIWDFFNDFIGAGPV